MDWRSCSENVAEFLPGKRAGRRGGVDCGRGAVEEIAVGQAAASCVAGLDAHAATQAHGGDDRDLLGGFLAPSRSAVRNEQEGLVTDRQHYT